MSNKILIGILVLVVLIGVLIFKSTDGFTSSKPADVAMENEVEKPYSRTPINKLGDYDDPRIDYILTPSINHDETEADVVAAQEGEYDQEVSDYVKNQRMNQRHFDYPQLPPISLTRQIEQAKHKADLAANAAPLTLEGFADIEGQKMKMPDRDEIEAEERKLLATYEPKRSKELLTYSTEDAEELIKKIYDKRGLIPSYKQRPDGTWEVYETMEKNPKIVWEDDIPRETDRLASAKASEESIYAPTYASTVAAGLDPFFEPRVSMRTNRQDYMRWTPGLERMFAPTKDESGAWY